jgi:hypothetical protein
LTASNVELSGTYFGNYTNTVAETSIFSTVGAGSLSAVSGLTAWAIRLWLDQPTLLEQQHARTVLCKRKEDSCICA